YVKSRPHLKGVMLAGHGIICWGDTSKACYDNTIGLVARAAGYLNQRLAKQPAFGGCVIAPQSVDQRHKTAALLMPRLRALMAGSSDKVGHFTDDEETLEFVG